MAAGGYPEEYQKGDLISGINEVNSSDCKAFHAGTQLEGETVLTNGGRVLCVTALGETAKEAQNKAYQAVSGVQWNNTYFRTDIGYRAINRENDQS
jgi:phosphoribosylamine--glycine ligase